MPQTPEIGLCNCDPPDLTVSESEVPGGLHIQLSCLQCGTGNGFFLREGDEYYDAACGVYDAAVALQEVSAALKRETVDTPEPQESAEPLSLGEDDSED